MTVKLKYMRLSGNFLFVGNDVISASLLCKSLFYCSYLLSPSYLLSNTLICGYWLAYFSIKRKLFKARKIFSWIPCMISDGFRWFLMMMVALDTWTPEHGSCQANCSLSSQVNSDTPDLTIPWHEWVTCDVLICAILIILFNKPFFYKEYLNVDKTFIHLYSKSLNKGS